MIGSTVENGDVDQLLATKHLIRHDKNPDRLARPTAFPLVTLIDSVETEIFPARDGLPSRVDIRMVHEETANQIMPVPQPPAVTPVGEQQQPGVFDAAGRKNEEPGRYTEAPSLRRRDMNGRDRICRGGGFQFHGIGVEQCVNVGCPPNIVKVPATEMSSRAELENPGSDQLRLQRRRATTLPNPPVHLVSTRAKLADRFCPTVVRVEVCPVEWPAAVRDPRSGLEVDRIQRTTPPGPDRRGSAEACLACLREIEVRGADVLAREERLGGTVRPQATGFQQAYPERPVKELLYHREAGGASADDTDVALHHGIVGKRARVDDQAYYLMIMSAIRALLHGSIDYAGLFPPAGLDMSSAVANYHRYRSGPDAWALGRFVVPVSRLGEFETARAQLPFQPSAPWPLALLIGTDPTVDLDLLSRSGPGRNRIDSLAGSATVLEVKATSEDGIGEIMGRLPPGLVAYFEVPIDPDPGPLITTIGQLGGRAKVRTGGVTTDSFPSTGDLGRFISLCASAAVAFKATAGLHHPLRGEYRLTYQPDSPRASMFGFLNLFLAVAFLRGGMSQGETMLLLEERSTDSIRVEEREIVWRGHRIGLKDIQDTRRDGIISFGSCSFSEPIGDLEALHMLLPRAQRT